MEEKKLVPKRRFDKFKLDWEQKRFGDYFNIVSGYAFKKSDYVLSGIPIINGESIQNGELKTDNLNYLPESFYEEYNSFLVNANDIVIGLNRPIINNKLKISLIPKELNNSLLYQRAGKIINLKNLHNYFSYQLLEKEVLKFVKEESVGSDQPFISTTDLLKSKLSLPNNENEQQKIGKFFKIIDERIANQERKIAKVKALKSAYLTEMFPQEGEVVPKRRFKGFEGEWKTIELGSIGTTFSGLSGKTKNDFGHGTAEYVTYMNVFNNTISDIKVTEKVIRDDKQTQLKYGDILFTTSSETPSEVGMSSVWLGDRPNVYLNSFCFGLRTRTSVYLDHYFMGYLLRANLFRKQMEILAQGISRYNISKSRVMEISVYLPSIKEQQKIGAFFKNIDDQITTEEKKLQKLKKMKEAYLEEMFV